MLKSHGIHDARTALEERDDLDVMEESMLNMLSFLDDHHTSGIAMPEYGLILFRTGRDGFALDVRIEFDGDSKFVSTTIKMPLNCAKEKRTTFGDLLHMTNFGASFPAWVFDPRDGECRYRLSHFVGDTSMSVVQAEHMIKLSLSNMYCQEDTIIPLLMGKEPDPEKSSIQYDLLNFNLGQGGTSGANTVRNSMVHHIDGFVKAKLAKDLGMTPEEIEKELGISEDDAQQEDV